MTVAGQSAFAGRSSGGQVALVTRSGTNTLHGSAYEYNRNTAYARPTTGSITARTSHARNWFAISSAHRSAGPSRRTDCSTSATTSAGSMRARNRQSRTVPSESLKQGNLLFKTTDNALYTLTPADLKAIDPLHIGETPTMLALLKQYPVGNAPQTGSDAGLNFSGYLFNAPVKLDYRTYVATIRLDGRFSRQTQRILPRHAVQQRSDTALRRSSPVRKPPSSCCSDNRGFGVRYTAVVTPTMTNTASVGLNRIGFTQTGTIGPSFRWVRVSSVLNYNSSARGSARINPMWNFTDDITWVKGSHTVHRRHQLPLARQPRAELRQLLSFLFDEPQRAARARSGHLHRRPELRRQRELRTEPRQQPGGHQRGRRSLRRAEFLLAQPISSTRQAKRSISAFPVRTTSWTITTSSTYRTPGKSPRS